MAAWTHLRRLMAVAVGSGTGLVLYKYLQSPHVVEASWTNSSKPINPYALWDSNWDGRDPRSMVRPVKNDSAEEQNRYNSELKKVVPKAVRHIVLVRHGEYLAEGPYDEDHHLTARGRLQTKYTGQRLQQLGFEWDNVIASTMMRAQETLEIVLKEINCDLNAVSHCSMLREGAPIEPQPPRGHWRPEQTFCQDGARIEAAFRRYFYRALPDQQADSYTLIIGHANVLRYFICRALQIPPEAWLRISLNHASITWLTITPSGHVSVRCMGDSGFLPPEHLTNRMPKKTHNVV